MHVHKYRRMNIARKGNPEYWVMQCGLPNCNHYVPMQSKLSAPNMIGKVSLCNSCNAEFEFSKRSQRQAKPTCEDCIKESPVHKTRQNEMSKFLDGLIK